MTRRYLFLEIEGLGPVKSTEIRSKGFIARTSLPAGGLKNVGFSSEQITHWEQTFLTSSREYGKFLIFM